MDILTKLIFIILSLVFIALNLVLMLVPTPIFNKYLTDRAPYMINNLYGNYFLSLLGAIIIGAIIYIMRYFLGQKKKEYGKFINLETEAGNINISSKAIYGLVQDLIRKNYPEIQDPKIRVVFEDDLINLKIQAHVNTEIDMLDTINSMQASIGERVKEFTSLEVGKVDIYIEDIAEGNRNLK